ncbi:MAG: hypothetical protein K0U12_03115 [Gammaproteobacteria bacterium]|nr:hypothetical protein [Gammaproteobacteria bacterium]
MDDKGSREEQELSGSPRCQDGDVNGVGDGEFQLPTDEIPGPGSTTGSVTDPNEQFHSLEGSPRADEKRKKEVTSDLIIEHLTYERTKSSFRDDTNGGLKTRVFSQSKEALTQENAAKVFAGNIQGSNILSKIASTIKTIKRQYETFEARQAFYLQVFEFQDPKTHKSRQTYLLAELARSDVKFNYPSHKILTEQSVISVLVEDLGLTAEQAKINLRAYIFPQVDSEFAANDRVDRVLVGKAGFNFSCSSDGRYSEELTQFFVAEVVTYDEWKKELNEFETSDTTGITTRAKTRYEIYLKEKQTAHTHNLVAQTEIKGSNGDGNPLALGGGGSNSFSHSPSAFGEDDDKAELNPEDKAAALSHYQANIEAYEKARSGLRNVPKVQQKVIDLFNRYLGRVKTALETTSISEEITTLADFRDKLKAIQLAPKEVKTEVDGGSKKTIDDKALGFFIKDEEFNAQPDARAVFIYLCKAVEQAFREQHTRVGLFVNMGKSDFVNAMQMLHFQLERPDLKTSVDHADKQWQEYEAPEPSPVCATICNLM